MDTRKSKIILASVAAVTLFAQQQAAPTGDTGDRFADRLNSMSEAEQIAYVNSAFDRGMPPELVDGVAVLLQTHSAVVLPVLESRIEETLKSASPVDSFTDKTVTPQKVIDLTAQDIAWAGDENALKAISRLIAIDEKRFGRLINGALISAEPRRNPFVVAYSGFELREAATDRRIAAWAEQQFDDRSDHRQRELKRLWAEAMAEKYGHAPNEVDWANDPIATRLNPSLAASLHDEIFRLGAEAAAARAKK
jgi:hypothetical protein